MGVEVELVFVGTEETVYFLGGNGGVQDGQAFEVGWNGFGFGQFGDYVEGLGRFGFFGFFMGFRATHG